MIRGAGRTPNFVDPTFRLVVSKKTNLLAKASNFEQRDLAENALLESASIKGELCRCVAKGWGPKMEILVNIHLTQVPAVGRELGSLGSADSAALDHTSTAEGAGISQPPNNSRELCAERQGSTEVASRRDRVFMLA